MSLPLNGAMYVVVMNAPTPETIIGKIVRVPMVVPMMIEVPNGSFEGDDTCLRNWRVRRGNRSRLRCLFVGRIIIMMSW